MLAGVEFFGGGSGQSSSPSGNSTILKDVPFRLPVKQGALALVALVVPAPARESRFRTSQRRTEVRDWLLPDR